MNYKGYFIQVHYDPSGWDWEVFKGRTVIGESGVCDRGNDDQDAAAIAKKFIDELDDGQDAIAT